MGLQMSEQMYKVHWSDIRGHEGVQDTKLSLEEALKLDKDKNSIFAEMARKKLDKMSNYPGFNYC